MAIALVGLNSPQQLKAVVQKCCPEDERWKLIVETEQEMDEYRNSMGDAEAEAIAYEIMDGTEVLGLLQYHYTKGGFLKKERLVIELLTLTEYDSEVIRRIHQTLVQKHSLSGELIHVISTAEENTPIHRWLVKSGFAEQRNDRRHPKYGGEAGSLYFVKQMK